MICCGYITQAVALRSSLSGRVFFSMRTVQAQYSPEQVKVSWDHDFLSITSVDLLLIWYLDTYLW